MRVGALIVKPKKDVVFYNIPCNLETFEGVVEGRVSLMDLPYGYLLVHREGKGKEYNKTILERSIEDTFLIVKKDIETGIVMGLEEEQKILIHIFSKEKIMEEDFDLLVSI